MNGAPTFLAAPALQNLFPSLAMQCAAAFGAALLFVLLVTPGVCHLAWKCNAIAKPDARRLHPKPIAQWGGLAVFLGVACAALIWRQPSLADIRSLAPSASQLDIEATRQTVHLSLTFFGCGALMLLLGMVDDRFELNPALKMGGQFVIVYLMWRGGVRIHSLPFTSGTQSLNDASSFALTALWTLGLINGVNFIDGVDGLAAGVCAIAAGSLCIVEILKGATWAAAAAAALSGGCVGFLRYNFAPARIFLGDAGSLLLGFWLAFIAVAAAAKTAAATTLALPLLVLGVPVFDALWAVVRRTLAGQPVWRADRGHLHHRLLARGYSPQKTAVTLYAIGGILGALAIALATR